MEQKEYEKKKQKRNEGVVIMVYTIYVIAMIMVSIMMKWPSWLIPTVVYGAILVWFCHIKSVYSERFRAFLIAGMSFITFGLYACFSSSFEGLLSTFGALVVLLGILNIPEFIYLEVVFSVFFIVVHGFVKQTIVFDSTVDIVYALLRMGSLFAGEWVTYYLVKTHQEMNLQLQEVIEDLKVVEQSKDDFLANVSHEIRTPINTISGMSEMILREEISDKVRTDIFHMQAAGRNLHAIVSDILDYTELENGKMEIIEEPYNLTSTIHDVINMATARKGEKPLEIIVDCDAKIPCSLLGDEQKLRRIIMNLMDNAIKFTEKGLIMLGVSARQEIYGVNLCIKVKDTGIGIDEENLEKLFHTFNQMDTKRNRQEGGIGIGLAITKKMVSKMGGVIDVKSELGKGSEFQIVIPQKLIDERPMVSVKDAENINIIIYINVEKYVTTEIRDAYFRLIQNMSEGLECRYHLCRNLQEFKRRMEREIFTHAFISVEEYREDMAYFEEISKQITVVFIQDKENIVPVGDRIWSLYKPLYILSIASVLNQDVMLKNWDFKHIQENKFIAPEASVLVVDDNMTNLSVVEGLLAPYKIKVFIATSGKEAIFKLDRMMFDLVFMDHMMPEMDGVETAHRIRRKKGTYFQQLPIIALTANVIGGAREMFLAEGFQDYVPKPIEISQLERVLRKYIPKEKLIEEDESKIYELPDEVGNYVAQNLIKVPKSVSCIDRNKGLYYCGSSQENYEEILQVYLKNGIKEIRNLEQDYIEKDWDNYTIRIHAVKSTSFGIGAEILGKLAKALEQAGKERDIAYIEQHHREMMTEYQKVLMEIGGEEIPEKLNTEYEKEKMVQEKKTELKCDEFKSHLQELIELLDTFEKDIVTEKIQKLSEFCFQGEDLEQMLQPVRNQVEQFDFIMAIDIVTQLLEDGGKEND